MGNGNIEVAKRLLDERKSRKKTEIDVDDKVTIFDVILAIILFLFPVIAFITSSVSLVKNLSSYERFVAWYEK